jgi:S-adenosylmethionine synthetase
VYIDTYWTSKASLTDGEIAEKIWTLFDLRPYTIEKKFHLRSPIYEETAAYGHFGRERKIVEKYGKNVELFPWEKLDSVELLKKEFGLQSQIDLH